MRERDFALLLSIIAWILCLRFVMKRASCTDNGIEKLNTFWSKLAFSTLLIAFIIVLISIAGLAVELIGIIVQKLAEFLALPLLRLFGLS